ncbi:hypothetical protein BN1723_020906, partial [Verticillium longisporum]
DGRDAGADGRLAGGSRPGGGVEKGARQQHFRARRLQRDARGQDQLAQVARRVSRIGQP